MPHLNQEAPIFPTFCFFTEAHAEKYLMVKNFDVVKDKDFDVENLEGYKELSLMLEERGYMTLNNIIKETNKSIGLEFYAHVDLRMFKGYTSYVQGMSIDYNSFRINALLHILPPRRCSAQNRMSVHLSDRMSESMLATFYNLVVEWVIINGKWLRLHNIDMLSILREFSFLHLRSTSTPPTMGLIPTVKAHSTCPFLIHLTLFLCDILLINYV